MIFINLAAGWLVAAIAILQIPGWGLWVVYKQEGSTWIEVYLMKTLKIFFLHFIWIFKQKWKSSFRPSDEWGPVNLKLKREWLKYNQVAPPFSWIPKICRRSKRTKSSIPSEELDDRDTTQIVHDYSKRSKSRTKQEEQDPNPDERLVWSFLKSRFQNFPLETSFQGKIIISPRKLRISIHAFAIPVIYYTSFWYSVIV